MEATTNKRKLKIISQTPTEMLVLVERFDNDNLPSSNAIISSNLNKILSKISSLEQAIQSTQECTLTENGVYKPNYEISNKADEMLLQDEIEARINQSNKIDEVLQKIISNQKVIANKNGRFALGGNANSSSDFAIQIGTGTNSTYNSFQFFDDTLCYLSTNTFNAPNIKISDGSGSNNYTISITDDNRLKFSFGV